jgi:putative transposase
VSTNLTLDIAINTIHELKKHKSFKLAKGAFVHSDQGCHYTSPIFQNLLIKYGLKQSMSRRGSCWDNAPQESFFGHFKDEAYIRSCRTYDELVAEFDEYMDYYNNHRRQWNLKKMTPVEYRNHLLQIAI